MRTGVFEQVLQETCLAVFGQNPAASVTVNKISIENSRYSVDRVGVFDIHSGAKPWVIAREPAEAYIINKVKNIDITLHEYGYKVSTGQ